MQFIAYDPTRKEFQLTQEAIDILNNDEFNVVLVFNIGEPGCGKSFMVNQILDLNSQQASFRQSTAGLQIWSEPIIKEKDSVKMLFVDVEGLGQDEQFSQFVWLLAFLLGAIVIYSSSGDIGKHTWQNLGAFQYLSDSLVFSENYEENLYTMSYYSPYLIWCVKDNQAELQPGDEVMLKSNEYFE